MFDQLPKRYQTKGSNPTKARKDVSIRPAQKGQCQKGSKWSLSRVRPRSRFRTRLRRAKEIRSISGKEKPQVTKRYRTRRLRVFVIQKYYVRLPAFVDSLTDCQVSRSTVCKVLDRINRIRGTYLRLGFISLRRIEQNP